METDVINEQVKQRHKFVTFWIWLMIVFNVIFATVCAMSGIGSDIGVLSVILVLLPPALTIAGCVFMLCWKKIGFWLVVAGALLSLILGLSYIAIIVYDPSMVEYVICRIIAVFILLAIIQIKKDGVSFWKNLK